MFREEKSDSGGSTNILDNLDKFDNITPDIKKLLEYIFKSDRVRFRVLFDFTTFLQADSKMIEEELKNAGKTIKTDRDS